MLMMLCTSKTRACHTVSPIHRSHDRRSHLDHESRRKMSLSAVRVNANPHVTEYTKFEGANSKNSLVCLSPESPPEKKL